MTGGSADSGAGRSTTSTLPEVRPSTSADRSDMHASSRRWARGVPSIADRAPVGKPSRTSHPAGGRGAGRGGDGPPVRWGNSLPVKGGPDGAIPGAGSMSPPIPHRHSFRRHTTRENSNSRASPEGTPPMFDHHGPPHHNHHNNWDDDYSSSCHRWDDDSYDDSSSYHDDDYSSSCHDHGHSYGHEHSWS